MQSIQVLFEDNHFIAINKNVSDIVQSDKSGDKSLEEIVKKYIKEKYQKTGDIFLGVAHRLDRPVSGVLLFARTGKALQRINKMFQERRIQKIYWTIVKNKPPKNSDYLLHYLVRNSDKNVNKAFTKEVAQSQKAELNYKLIGSSNNYFFLEIKPLTGRHHQIRAQLQAIGCPIKGDLKYGFVQTNYNGGIHLHARKMEFIHPVKNQSIQIIANPPKDILWDEYVKIAEEKFK